MGLGQKPVRTVVRIKILEPIEIEDILFKNYKIYSDLGLLSGAHSPSIANISSS